MTIQNTERLEQIETRLAYQDQAIETLSALVYEQQQQITRLIEEHSTLQQKFNSLAGPDSDASGADERPPHY